MKSKEVVEHRPVIAIICIGWQINISIHSVLHTSDLEYGQGLHEAGATDWVTTREVVPYPAERPDDGTVLLSLDN